MIIIEWIVKIRGGVFNEVCISYESQSENPCPWFHWIINHDIIYKISIQILKIKTKLGLLKWIVWTKPKYGSNLALNKVLWLFNFKNS